MFSCFSVLHSVTGGKKNQPVNQSGDFTTINEFDDGEEVGLNKTKAYKPSHRAKGRVMNKFTNYYSELNKGYPLEVEEQQDIPAGMVPCPAE